jgi:hypothetical protein
MLSPGKVVCGAVTLVIICNLLNISYELRRYPLTSITDALGAVITDARTGGSVRERIYASGICMNLLIKDDLPIEELGRYA